MAADVVRLFTEHLNSNMTWAQNLMLKIAYSIITVQVESRQLSIEIKQTLTDSRRIQDSTFDPHLVPEHPVFLLCMSSHG